MNREWAIPVALGLLATAAFAPAAKQTDDPVEGDPTLTVPSLGHRQSILLFPFDVGPVIVDKPAQILVLSSVDQPLGVRERNETWPDLLPCGHYLVQPDPPCEGFGVDWRTPRVGFGNTSGPPSSEDPHNPGMLRCDCAFFGPGLHTQAPEGSPRLGMDGYNATRATIYVFDERGLLAATTDTVANHTRFNGSPTRFASELWYIGANATVPNGTEPVPDFARGLLPKLLPLLHGLPVGGVASTTSNAYVAFYGTLFITARIDALAYAP